MSNEISLFLDLLTRRGLVSNRLLSQLHRQVAEKGERGKTVPLDSLAKLLVEKGHLTQHQADSLVAESRNAQEYAETELGLAPIEDQQFDEPEDLAPEAPDPALAETKAGTEDLSEAQAAALLKPVETPTGGTQAGASQPASASEPHRAAADSILDDLPVELADPTLRPRRIRRAAARSEWDSPLLLIGGGSLLVLVLIGGLVWYLVRTDTGNAQLQAARQAYEDGAYSQAVEEYERFLESHASHDEASAARVQLGLARVRRSLDSGASLDLVLEQAQQVISEIESEAAFGDAGRELAAILPSIAEGLANDAAQASSSESAKERSDQTEAALALLINTKYVPKSFRPVERMEAVRSTLASVQRRLERETDLAAALDDISAALEAQSFQAAYQAHRKLVEKHVDAARLDEIESAARAIARAEAASLRFQEDARPASTDERDDESVHTTLLTSTSGNSSPNDPQSNQGGVNDAAESIAYVRIDGGLFAIDVASGKVLWRRYVGIQPHLPPVKLPGGNLLAVDTEHGELLRLAGRTGELVWRQSIGEIAGNVALSLDAALIPTADARLLFIDLETGESRGHIAFAQPLATTPAVDAANNRIFVVGEHSSVYVLAADQRNGEDAIFVGHAPGTVTVPPIAYGRTVCIVENFAASRSHLHAYALTSEAAPQPDDGPSGDGADAVVERAPTWTMQTQSIRLTGRVTTAMARSGRRLAVVTDAGDIRVYDVAQTASGPPFSPVASQDASSEDPIDRFGLLEGNHLWLADTRLARLQILATGGRLRSQQLDEAYRGDTFTQPLQVVSGRVVHVRRPQGGAGYLVAATDLETGAPLWETEASVPPVELSALPEAGKVAVATANGRLYSVDSTMRDSDEHAPQAGSSQMVVEGGAVEWTFSDRWAAASRVKAPAGITAAEASHVLSVLPIDNLDASPRDVAMPGQLAARVSFFGRGVVAPLRVGQVLLVDPASGAGLAAPFQPPLDPRQLPEWTTAQVVRPNESFVIGDRRGIVYLVSLVDESGSRALVGRSQEIASPILGELCATSSSVLLATADGRLAVLSSTDLAPEKSPALEGDVTWGPFAAVDHVLYTSDGNRLHCLTHDGRAFVESSIHAPAVGKPVALGPQVIGLALADGTLLSVDTAGRTVETLAEMGQPVAKGPLLVGGRLYTATPDGTLLSLQADNAALVAAVTGRD